jgi:YXWGXW repeat-containing protein
MKTRMLNAIMAAGVAALVSTACETYGASGALYVQTAPPPMQYEVVTVAPGPGFVWVSGYWEWSGVQYVWVSGRWQRPPSGYTVWYAPRYERRNSGWYYQRGHWGGGHGHGRGHGHDRDDHDDSDE